MDTAVQWGDIKRANGYSDVVIHTSILYSGDVQKKNNHLYTLWT